MFAMESGRIPPAVLFRSLMMVCGGYVAVWGAILVAVLAGSRWFFPDSFAILTSPNLMPEEIRRRSAELLPVGLFWIAAVSGTATGCLAGWFFRWSSSARGWGPVLLLAVLLFASGLQMVVGAQPEVRWMTWLLTVLLPAGVLAGAQLVPDRLPESGEGDDEDQP